MTHCLTISFKLFCTCECRLCSQADGCYIMIHVGVLIRHFIDRPISAIDTLACIELCDEHSAADTRWLGAIYSYFFSLFRVFAACYAQVVCNIRVRCHAVSHLAFHVIVCQKNSNNFCTSFSPFWDVYRCIDGAIMFNCCQPFQNNL